MTADNDSPSASPTDSYDVVVIGGGPAGENAAQYATQDSDLTAAIIEAELVGGECSYWACMPSKAMLRPVDLLAQAKASPAIPIAADARPDLAEVLKWRDAITHNLDDSGQVEWADGIGIDVIRGRARIDGERVVTVSTSDGTTRTVLARQAVIVATGTTAAIAPVDGLADALPWTSRDVTNMHELPTRVAVVGGGVVACESATWLAGLGAQVTLIQRSGSLLAGNEPFAGELVAQQLEKAGVDLRFDAHLTAVRRADAQDTGYGHIHGGQVELDVDGETLHVDEVVVATGRKPATADLGLDAVGVQPNAHGYLDTDDHLGVGGSDWLYAVGDANGRALLTHMGKYQGRICGAVIAARAAGESVDGPQFNASADHAQVPQVTFTAPQVASVGLMESAARDAGIDVRTAEFDLVDISGAYVQDPNYVGHAKLVVDQSAQVVVGATFVGPDVAELLHSATIAVVARVPLSVLWHAVPSYPTVSEVWLRLQEALRAGS